jgi:MoaA/NifB/PqqE/SkfB family radical SAM enzyme
MTGATLLWALRSPCNLGCLYCYFGTIEEHRDNPPAQPGVLSHRSRTDLGLADIAAFVDTLPGSRVERVFLAGGEPLIWPPIMGVVQAIKRAGVQVVLCTNGIPLGRAHLVEQILDTHVDAVSVSLDSVDAAHNDAWRPARNRHDGHAQVLAGVRALLAARRPAQTPRVGLYAAITRRNIDAIVGVAALAAELGCDYFVPQPISLDADHPQCGTLSLTPDDLPALQAALDHLYANPQLRLPDPTYPDRFLATVRSDQPGRVAGCFGGTDLFFIEPDGSVWDCPSTLKVKATPASRHRSIRGQRAAALFGPARPCADCALFSRDCVSMWPLMGFTAWLNPTGAPT